jgi:hypothetical protein
MFCRWPRAWVVWKSIILTLLVFLNSLVDWGRRVPAAGSRYHGRTTGQAPGLEDGYRSFFTTRRFRSFCGELIAEFVRRIVARPLHNSFSGGGPTRAGRLRGFASSLSRWPEARPQGSERSRRVMWYASRRHSVPKSGKARRSTGISGREPGSTSGSRHGLGDLFTALRRQGLIGDELVLQLATFLRSLDLFLELIVMLVLTGAAQAMSFVVGRSGRWESITNAAIILMVRELHAQRRTN